MKLKPAINKIEPLKLDVPNLDKAHNRIRALRHELRRQILFLISQYDCITVTDIYVKLRLEQSVASQHLGVLRQARFLKTKREGKYIYYYVDKNELEDFQKRIETLLD